MLMRRRLYFILPDTRSARELFDEMLLARIEERRMHFLSRRGSLPGDLPEATLWQKTDAVHGACLGVAIGGVAGALGGVLAVLFPPGGLTLQLATVRACGGIARSVPWCLDFEPRGNRRAQLATCALSCGHRAGQGPHDDRRPGTAHQGDLGSRCATAPRGGRRRVRGHAGIPVGPQRGLHRAQSARRLAASTCAAARTQCRKWSRTPSSARCPTVRIRYSRLGPRSPRQLATRKAASSTESGPA